MKERIAVFFGGKSCEHDVSIITGMQVLLALENTEKYIVTPVYISQSGEMYTSEILKDVSKIKDFKNMASKFKKVVLQSGCDEIFELSKNKLKKTYKISCAVLATHGENGEDGSLQGLLKMCGIPQTSGSVMSQGIGMDKEISKFLAVSCGANILPFKKYKKSQAIKSVLAEIDQEGNYPYIIKPNSLGSSIGVKFCTNISQLCEGLEVAFLFAEEVLCERGAVDFCELNISCVKLGEKIICSDIEKPKQWHEILTFEDKYLQKGKIKSGDGIKREFPAKIPAKTKEQLEKTATALYEKFKLSGIVRFDFILEGETLYFNEVNTIPGSLSSYLWQGKFKFGALLEKVIEEAKNAESQRQKCEYFYKSSIL